MAALAVATKIRRGLSEKALGSMNREVRRTLIQALVAEHGHKVASTSERGWWTDLVLTIPVLGHDHRVLVRLGDEPWPEDAHQDAAGDAARAGCATHLLIGSADDPPSVRAHSSYLSLAAFVDLVESSALVRWDEQTRPSPDRKAYVEWRSRVDQLQHADPTGLRWLPSLALNKLPVELRGSSIPAETRFEEAVFRVGTRILGLRGRRLGADRPGQREPDGLFVGHNSDHGALYDAKAARDGFEMTAAEERKLIEYARRSWSCYGTELSMDWVVVVSSAFPGAERSFERRRSAFGKSGVELVYLPASAVIELALPLATTADGAEAARHIDWHRLFREGIVTDAAAAEAASLALATARALGNEDR